MLNFLSPRIIGVVFICAVGMVLLGPYLILNDNYTIDMDKVMMGAKHTHIYFVDCTGYQLESAPLFEETYRLQPQLATGHYYCWDRFKYYLPCGGEITTGKEMDPILHWTLEGREKVKIASRLSEVQLENDLVMIPSMKPFYPGEKVPAGAKMNLDEVVFYHCDVLIKFPEINDEETLPKPGDNANFYDIVTYLSSRK